MKKIIIAALIVLALGVTGCSVSTGSSDVVEDAIAEMPDGDVSNPFAVEPTDEAEEDVSDDVVVEADDVVVEDDPVETESEGVFEMQTEADDVITDTVVGTYYEQSFRMVDKNRVYNWSIEGLPAGSGLSLEEEAESWRYKLHGTPVAADVGTHQIIISVNDSDSNDTSISFELTVESNMPEIGINENYVNPCTKPLRIIVEKFGGHVDHEILGDGVFKAKVGSDANIKFRAVRGYPKTVNLIGSENTDKNTGGGMVPPVGEVKWTWTSQVKDSYHCQRVPKDDGQDHGWGHSAPLSDLYKYAWAQPIEGICAAYPNLSKGGEFEVEGKYTQNATWRTKARESSSDVLKLKGNILYDGPLPVRDLPVDEDAVELIDVTVTDGCAANNERKGSHKTIEIGIQYPVAGSQAEGGRLSDVEVEMDFGVVRHYWKGSSKFGTDCDDDGGYDGYKDVCEMNSKLVMVFTNEEGLSQTALNELENSWTPHKAIEESLGYIAYDFAACNEDDDNCDDRKVTIVDNQSDDLNAVQKVYLLWLSPSHIHPKVGKDETHQLDFDIEDIEFETKYWSADYEDDDNVFGYNLISKHGAVRSDTLTNLDGMSPANSNGGVFRRRPLAAHILKHSKPKSH